MVIELVPPKFKAYIPPTSEPVVLLPQFVKVLLLNAKLVTLLILIPTALLVPVIEILSNVTPVTAFRCMEPLHEELSTAGEEQIADEVVELVKFIFFREILLQDINSAPLLVIF